MSINLSLLPPDEKNRIEIDKQASFLVWKIREEKCGPDAISEHLGSIQNDQERIWFEESIAKYKQLMGVA